MSIQQFPQSSGTVSVENVGGIRATDVAFSPGVTLLVGRNATNRTSFLQAVMAALGGDAVSVRGDADEAHVELSLGDETYTRRLERRPGGIVTDGEPYLDDPTVAELFAFLLESNEARRAVATGGDLRELIMRPIDTEAIHAEIESLTAERDELKAELSELRELKGSLPELERRRTELRADLEEKQAAIEAKQAELDAADADVTERQAAQADLEETFGELREKRAAVDDIRFDLETERESIDALKGERQELTDAKGSLPDHPTGDIEDLEAEISRLRSRKGTLEAEVNELQSVIGFNEEMLEGTSNAVDVLQEPLSNVTDQLLDDEVTCWTCGSTVDPDQIRETLDRLRRLSQETVREVNELATELDDLTTERRALQRAKRERERIERRLTEIDAELDRREERIESLQADREALTADIEALEDEVDQLDHEEYRAVLELHKELNRLEYDRNDIESDLDEVEREIHDIERRLATEAERKAELEAVTADIEDLRTRIERIEREAVEQFNDHMTTVLELLGYENLDRIWLERVEREVREGRRTVSESAFELHVVRSTASGTAYEDTVDHLSESEREVTGLVFALGGYLAHEVYDTVPFMLLDSLEAIDSDRIATLVDYLSDYTGYLFAALLPEDAAALSDDYDRVTDI